MWVRTYPFTEAYASSAKRSAKPAQVSSATPSRYALGNFRLPTLDAQGDFANRSNFPSVDGTSRHDPLVGLARDLGNQLEIGVVVQNG
jgi:hypothetical protein